MCKVNEIVGLRISVGPKNNDMKSKYVYCKGEDCEKYFHFGTDSDQFNLNLRLLKILKLSI